MAYQSFNGVRPSIRIRILVVDDDYMCLNVVATTLRSLKYEGNRGVRPFSRSLTQYNLARMDDSFLNRFRVFQLRRWAYIGQKKSKRKNKHISSIVVSTLK